jgi:putative effector of murein hydrolase
MIALMQQSAYLWLAASLGLYLFFDWARARTGWSLLNPLLWTFVVLIAVLAGTHIPYATFHAGTQYLGFLLTPTTVCLAVPLYQQWRVLRRNLAAVAVGLICGVLSGLGSVLLIAWLVDLNHIGYVSLLPKSVTTAIGMGISQELGGLVPLTVGVITLTGMFGNLVASAYLRLIGVRDPVAVGLAIGTASHAVGTTRAFELGRVQGAMSSLSLALAGVITVILAPIFALIR